MKSYGHFCQILVGPDLTRDLNLVRGDPPGSVKYVGNQNQLRSFRSVYTET